MTGSRARAYGSEGVGGGAWLSIVGWWMGVRVYAAGSTGCGKGVMAWPASVVLRAGVRSEDESISVGVGVGEPGGWPLEYWR